MALVVPVSAVLVDTHHKGIILFRTGEIFSFRRKDMKKSFLIVMSALAVMSMVFTACSDPINNDATITNKTTVQTLEAPKNVTATGYGPTGFIRVSWDPVPNAVGYMLYRRTEGDGVATVKYIRYFDGSAVSATADLWHDDLADYDNQFKNGYSFTYKVIAVSNFSSNPKTDPSGWQNSSLSEWSVLQNSSKESNTVKFSNLKAVGAKLDKPANVNIEKKIGYSGGGIVERYEYIEATWTAVQGVQYLVSVGVANGLTANVPMTDSASTLVNYELTGTSGIAKIELPIIFGKVRVEVVAQHIGTQNGQTKYYADSDPGFKELDVAQTVLETPVVTATPRTSVNGLGEVVVLTWNKVYGADSYKIYRFVTSSNVYTTTGTAGGYVFDQWQEITGNIYYDPANYDNGNTTLTATDTILTGYNAGNDNNIYYMVVACQGTANVSAPGVSALVTRTWTEETLTATNLEWDNMTNADWLGVRLSWNSRSGEEFLLSRIELSLDNASNVIGTVGAYTDVPMTGAIKNMIGEYSMVDKPPVRKSWRYRLVTKLGDKTGYSYSNIIGGTDNQYRSNYLNVPIQISSNPNTYLPGYGALATGYQRVDAYKMGYRINLSELQIFKLKKLMADDEGIKISRRRTTAAGNQSWSSGSEWTEVTTIARDSMTTRWMADNETTYGYYTYQAEIVKNGAVSVKNLPYMTALPAALTSATSALSTNPAPNTPIVAGASVRFEILGQAATAVLNGAVIKVYIASGATSAEATARLDSTEDIRTLTLTRDTVTGAGFNDYSTTAVQMPSASTSTNYEVRAYVVPSNCIDEGARTQLTQIGTGGW
jgi:hypothetical protein